MKGPYTLIVILLLLSRYTSVIAQCSAGIQIDADGTGHYTFRAVNVTDTTTYSHYNWTVGTDTSIIDSNTLSTTYTFHTNGTYQVCLLISDTSTNCVLDTCKSFTVEDAEYYPLLRDQNIWNLIYNYCCVQPLPPDINTRSNCDALSYGKLVHTGNDTIISSFKYKPVIASSEFINACVIGFIREDSASRKVYIKDPVNGIEEVLYDFGMHVGDTIDLTLPVNSDFPQGTYRVDSIKTISIVSGKRKAFFLHTNKATSSPPLVWIEGVGNLGHPIYLYTGLPQGGCYPGCDTVNTYTGVIPYYNRSTVVCFLHIDYAYFDACLYDTISIYPFLIDSCFSDYVPCIGAVHEISTLSDFRISPNPSAGQIEIYMVVNKVADFNLKIWSIDGKQTLSSYPLGKISDGTFHKQLDLSTLPAGFYLVECTSGQGRLYRKLAIVK